ncbi:MAG TPA: YetF domain-containing protein [Actinomycetota bacterium]|nr:YetF domain-containing protein [Actinomycetota bacterium]
MEIVIRAAAVFLFLWLLMRAMGKKELAELSAFELVLLVVIGDLVQQGVTQEDMSVTGAILAVGTIALLVLLSSYIGFRSDRARRVIDGVPVVVIRDGEVLGAVLRVERLTEDDVVGAARQQGIASPRDVVVGVLEPDGRFSFIRRAEPAPPGLDTRAVR